MIIGSSKHFVLSTGSGSGSYNRSRQDDRGSGGYNRGRNDHDDDYGSRGGGGGYSRGRNDYSGGASGGNSYGGDDSRMETQRDTIFIQNLPKDVTTEALREAFSQIGLIKVIENHSAFLLQVDPLVFLFQQKDKKTGGPKIWIYKDKTTGEGKGEATVTYEDEQAAQAAIDWFDSTFLDYLKRHGIFIQYFHWKIFLDKEVLSNIVKVSLATRRASAFGGRGGFRGGRGGFRGRGKSSEPITAERWSLYHPFLGGGGGGGGGDFGGYRGRGRLVHLWVELTTDYVLSLVLLGGDRSGGGDYRGGGRGASHGSSRDNRSNPY